MRNPVLQRIRAAQREESGFTLIELLIVIVILGILAAIVVFAVNGIQDKGTASACRADVATVTVAAEAYDAQNGHYADGMDELVAAGLLHSVPSSDHYTIDYSVVGKRKHTRVIVSSTFCPAPDASAPTSAGPETTSSSSSDGPDAYCDEVRSPQNTYSRLMRPLNVTDNNVRLLALNYYLNPFDQVSSAQLSEQLATLERLATGDQGSDWQTLSEAFEQVGQLVTESGLTWSQLIPLYQDLLPGDLSQQQSDELQVNLQQPLSSDEFLSASRALVDNADVNCGVNIH